MIELDVIAVPIVIVVRVVTDAHAVIVVIAAFAV